MKLIGRIKNTALALTLAMMLAGCFGASAPTQGDEGAQDIEPGQKSIIEPPAARAPAGGNLEERPL